MLFTAYSYTMNKMLFALRKLRQEFHLWYNTYFFFWQHTAWPATCWLFYLTPISANPIFTLQKIFYIQAWSVFDKKIQLPTTITDLSLFSQLVFWRESASGFRKNLVCKSDGKNRKYNPWIWSVDCVSRLKEYFSKQGPRGGLWSAYSIFPTVQGTEFHGLVFEVEDHVHHNEDLRWQDVVGALSAFL